MSLKQYLILFIILLLVPGFLGKVSLQPFSDFFSHISLNSFIHAFSKVFQDDLNFYKGLVTPWFNQLINLIKNNIPKNTLKLQTP